LGNFSEYPGKIVLVGADAGRIRIIDRPVPASPIARPNGCGPFGADAGGSFGFFGGGIGVVAGCAAAGAAQSASTATTTGNAHPAGLLPRIRNPILATPVTRPNDVPKPQ
jgi:hypothetical protein